MSSAPDCFVPGTHVERELDDISGIWAAGTITKVHAADAMAELLYYDGSLEVDVPIDELRLLPTQSSEHYDSQLGGSSMLDRQGETEQTLVQAAPFLETGEDFMRIPAVSCLPKRRPSSVLQRVKDLVHGIQGLSADVDAISTELLAAEERIQECGNELSEASRTLRLRRVDVHAHAIDFGTLVDGLNEFQQLCEEITSSVPLELDGPMGVPTQRQVVFTPRMTDPGSASQHSRPEFLEAWVPSRTTKEAGCAVFATVRLSGYPWPQVLDTTVAWVCHYRRLGFHKIILFLDEPDYAKEVALCEAISFPDASGVVELIGRVEMESAWRMTGIFWDMLEGTVATEYSAKQFLNSIVALDRCRTKFPGIEWLCCNLDIDEALVLSDSHAPFHFAAVPEGVWQVVYLNHEALPSDSEGATWFDQADIFKVSPLIKLPFLHQHGGPVNDCESVVLDHPEGFGDCTVSYWQARNQRLADEFGFKRKGCGTVSYFDGYNWGKVAVRVSVATERCARPNVHRWTQQCDQNSGAVETSVCNPAHGSLLHYFHCGGFDWFSSKYACRTDEQSNSNWYNKVAQAQARNGEDALKVLYEETLLVPRDELLSQLEEGLLVSLGSSVLQPGCQLLKSAIGPFWGWAMMPAANGLWLHVPLPHKPSNEWQPPRGMFRMHEGSMLYTWLKREASE